METNENKFSRFHCRFSIWRYIGYGLLGVIGITAFALLFGLVIMWLWNLLIPTILHLTTITFLQAVGLAILGRLLFGSFNHGWHHRGPRGAWGHMKWANRNGNNCKPGWKKWNYYEQFWEEEGEKAFNEYVSKKDGDANKV
jgi:hypothetical protein